MAAGIQCIQYKNGSMHRIEEYAGMAIRTASKRAYLTGEGEKRKEWGCHLVIMNKRGNPCPKCLPFVGKILIDDVWSGGSSKDGSYPLMSSAMAAGLYHPGTVKTAIQHTFLESVHRQMISFQRKRSNRLRKITRMIRSNNMPKDRKRNLEDWQIIH